MKTLLIILFSSIIIFPQKIINNQSTMNKVSSIKSDTSSWSDDFENYSPGSQPSSWIFDGNGTDTSANYVDSTIAYEGNNSLRLYGIVGGCWGALAYHPIQLSPPFEIEVAIRNGNDSLSGCHPCRAEVGLREGDSWANPARSLILFNKNNTITGDGMPDLSSYNTLVWYDIKIIYELPYPDSVKVSYYINGNFKGSKIVPTITDEAKLLNLELNAWEGTAWFDNVFVTKVVTNINSNSIITINNYNLYQNYPNPFNPATKIKYSIPKTSLVTIKIYDILGREVETLVNGQNSPGNYNVEFDASKLSSGIYFYRMQAIPIGRQAGDFVSTKKLVLLK